MNWQEVCEDRSLQDLPFKIELNEYGQIVMSPASNEQGDHERHVKDDPTELPDLGS